VFKGWVTGAFHQPNKFSEDHVGETTMRWASTAVARLWDKPHRFYELIEEAGGYPTRKQTVLQSDGEVDGHNLIFDASSPAPESAEV